MVLHATRRIQGQMRVQLKEMVRSTQRMCRPLPRDQQLASLPRGLVPSLYRRLDNPHPHRSRPSFGGRCLSDLAM